MLLLPLTPSWAPSTRRRGRNQPGIILTLCCDASSARNGSSPSMALLRRGDSKAGELRPLPSSPSLPPRVGFGCRGERSRCPQETSGSSEAAGDRVLRVGGLGLGKIAPGGGITEKGRGQNTFAPRLGVPGGFRSPPCSVQSCALGGCVGASIDPRHGLVTGGFGTQQAGGKVRIWGWKVLPKQEDITIVIARVVLDCCSL